MNASYNRPLAALSNDGRRSGPDNRAIFDYTRSLMKKKAEPDYFVPALEKGLDILEALSVAVTPQTLADLARVLERTPGELFRMVDALEKRTYISRNLSGGYELTLKLYELAHTHSPIEKLLNAAQIPMRDLANRIHESCHLSVLNRESLLVIAEVESPDPIRLSVEVGHRQRPLESVSGRLLLAFLDPKDRKAYLEADDAYVRLSVRRQRGLLRELEQLRASGVHVGNSSKRTGVDISCFVGNALVGISAVLGVPFIAGGVNEGKERALIPDIRKHAQAITTSLGLQQTFPGKEQ
jgi:DNA-binding IclR family transcriptional regulator